MKHLLIILAIALTVVSCQKDEVPTHAEIIHQQLIDTIAVITAEYDLAQLSIFQAGERIWRGSDAPDSTPDVEAIVTDSALFISYEASNWWDCKSVDYQYIDSIASAASTCGNTPGLRLILYLSPEVILEELKCPCYR